MLPEIIATIDSHLRPPAIGRVFYVNHFTGANTNNGIDPGTPFNDITYALTQCVDGRNDYIIVEDCWNDEPAFPIVVNKTRVHIIGLGHGAMMPVYYPSITGGGVGAVFQLAGCHFSEIAGFDMLSAGQACIEMIAPLQASNMWIHDCTFGMSGPAQDGILALPPANNDDPNFGVIERCTFGWQLTRHGIWLSSPTKTTIRYNVFNSLAGGIGINLGTGAAGVGIVGDIIGNYFFAPIALALAAGWAITIMNGGAIISGNRASQAGDASGTNPYRDLSTGFAATCLNGWSDNFAGPALVVVPAVV
jgi:hypothetical protein